jgi:hypothetical protein
MVAVAAAVLPATATASGSPAGPPPAPLTQPYQQCPAVYLDPSCGYLIDITNSGAKVLPPDASVGFYEGQDDILVGVQNDSSSPQPSIHIGVPGSGYESFGFDGDGLCTPGGDPVPPDCPFGPPGDPGDYWGPDAQLTADSGTTDSGTVTFPTPLQPGQYTYFSLESPFNGATVVTGSQNNVVQTQLTDNNTQFGARISDPSPVNVQDTATIMPAQVNGKSPMGGSITFTVYSDPNCTNQAAGVAPMTVAVPSGSNSVTSPQFGANLPSNARYYVQAAYTGDRGLGGNFDPSSTNCGDETVTFGTPPQKAPANVTTTLNGSNGAPGASITVPTGTAVTDRATVTSNGAPASGRVTYRVYSDPACTQAVPGVILGSPVSPNGVYPASNSVTLPLGTYYFQAFYSGNATVAPGKSTCGSEVLTVAPPCNCLSLAGYLNSFHVFGNESTRLEFNFHSAITCTTGAGGCAGSVTVFAPRGATFIDTSRARNGATGLKLRKSTAVLTFNCAGPCAAKTIQPAVTLQWVALKTVKVKVKRGNRFVKVKRTVPIRSFLPQGRAKKTIKVTLVEVCNGIKRTVVLSIKFDKHGQVDYKASDLNGDGRPDGGRLNDLNGFV